mgnify:FL=1
MVSNENMMRAMLATKQLEIDKLKRTIKGMEDDNSNRQRDLETRKKTKRSTKSNDSD